MEKILESLDDKGLSSPESDSDIAKAFSIIGDGEAKVIWQDGNAGACTAKVSDGRWVVTLPRQDKMVQLHEMGHVLYTSFETNALKDKMSAQANTLLAILEDARTDTLVGEHFGEDLKGYHAAELKAESTSEIWNEVVKLAYNKSDALTPMGERIKEQFGARIEKVQHSKDKWATGRLAFEIDSANPVPPTDEEPEKGDDDDKDSVPGDESGEGQDGKGQDKSEDKSEDKSDEDKDSDSKPSESDSAPNDDEDTDDENEQENSADKDDDETKWQEAKDSAQREASSEKNAKSRRARERVKREKEKGPHDYDLDLSPLQEPTVFSVTTQLVMEETAGLTQVLKRHGQPTTAAWKLQFGDTKVFTRPAKRRGRVIIMVDLSGSMGCWCESHNGSVLKRSGWLAWQAAAALSSRLPDAQLFGFSATHRTNLIMKLETGNQPICRHRSPYTAVGSGNPDCVALEYIQTMLEGNLSGASAIMISDGEPAGPSPLDSGNHLYNHTKELANKMHQSGMKFASVLVKKFDDDDIYPSDLQVHIKNEEDLSQLGPAIKSILEGNVN